jgi:hypothetical protein
MSSVTQNPEAATDWQQEIRALEERDRVAFLAGDTSTLDAMWDDRLLVNSPLNVVNDKGRVLELLGSGRIRHTMDEVGIEQIARYGEHPDPPPFHQHLAAAGRSLADDRATRSGDCSPLASSSSRE